MNIAALLLILKGFVMKSLVLALLVSLVITGCASAGKNFTIDNANSVKNGMTREEVIKIMGTTPYSIQDGGKTFVWSYAEVGFFGGTESRAVKFKFDAAGKTYGIPENGVFGDTKKYQD